MENLNYYIPTNLLGTSSAKTEKGEKIGYTTYIMYLAPHKQNTKGKNVCANASKGCAKACLYKSGRGKFSNVELARINKTDYFFGDKNGFLEQLIKEISKAQKKHLKNDSKYCVRLNGTSDLPIENIKYKGQNLLEMFPNVQFYDYTKSVSRMLKYLDGGLPSNYHLTFSRSEDNDAECDIILAKGGNVAMVFKKDIPTSYRGYKVINGDENDLRFLDQANVIVGLKYKKVNAEADLEALISGFVIDFEYGL
jgi:hypothetical protein